MSILGCTGALALYPIAHFLVSKGSLLFTAARDLSILSGLAALWVAIRALSSRIPQMGKPYYSDDGTLSALSGETPRDLSIPWLEVLGITIELLLFTAAYILAIRWLA